MIASLLNLNWLRLSTAIRPEKLVSAVLKRGTLTPAIKALSIKGLLSSKLFLRISASDAMIRTSIELITIK